MKKDVFNQKLVQTKEKLTKKAQETGLSLGGKAKEKKDVLEEKARKKGAALGEKAKDKLAYLREENKQVIKAESFYRAYEKYLPLLSFVAGFTWDSLTLSRIDRLIDNIILLVYLTGLISCVILANLAAKNLLIHPKLAQYGDYYPIGMQFFLGSLFSAYVVYYFQSASLSKNLLFVGLLILMMIAVEAFKHRLGNYHLQLAMLYLVSHSFFAFFFPILVGRVGFDIFLFAGLFSLFLVVLIIAFFFRKGVIVGEKSLYLGLFIALFSYFALSGLYRANLIPPVPLALKYAEIYHSYKKQGDQYILGYEKAPWYQFWRAVDQPFHFAPGDQMVAFTSLFAPEGLQTTITQRWLWRGAESQDWSLIEAKKLTITGGRAQGWRNLQYKKRSKKGFWRVEVLSHEGKLLGEVDFEVQMVKKAQYQLGYQTR